METNSIDPNSGGTLVKDINNISPKTNLKEILLPAVIILSIILAGLGTGYILAGRKTSKSSLTAMLKGEKVISGSKEVGIKDEKVFKDSAEGRIEVNDRVKVEEGSHKLIRSGGESQTAYLTSSVVDLNQFIGKCVQIWGETFSAQKAGWLMDVGRVKILDNCPEGV